MSVEDRRRAIVEAVVPLLLERRDQLTTRTIAAAAGVAEGTLFRVFEDKRALLVAAAREAIEPSQGRSFADDLVCCTTLPEKVEAAVVAIEERIQRTMTVMMALGSGLADDPGGRPSRRPGGPPEFLRDVQERSHRALTELFAAHEGELRVSPEVAAVALRGLVVGGAVRGFDSGPTLTPRQITDLLLNGVRAENGPTCS